MSQWTDTGISARDLLSNRIGCNTSQPSYQGIGRSLSNQLGQIGNNLGGLGQSQNLSLEALLQAQAQRYDPFIQEPVTDPAKMTVREKLQAFADSWLDGIEINA